MNTTRPRHFPAYRLYKMRKGISNDKDLALQAGLKKQQLIHWACLYKTLKQEEAEKLAAFLDCEVTDIWEPETGRPVLIA